MRHKLCKEQADQVIAPELDDATLIKEGENAVGILARLPGHGSAEVLDALLTVAFAFRQRVGS